jgi:hypothetical protein
MVFIVIEQESTDATVIRYLRALLSMSRQNKLSVSIPGPKSKIDP